MATTTAHTTRTIETNRSSANKPMYWVIGALLVAALIAIFAALRSYETSPTERGVMAPAATTAPTSAVPGDTQMNMGTATDTGTMQNPAADQQDTGVNPATGETVNQNPTNDMDVPPPQPQQ